MEKEDIDKVKALLTPEELVYLEICLPPHQGILDTLALRVELMKTINILESIYKKLLHAPK